VGTGNVNFEEATIYGKVAKHYGLYVEDASKDLGVTQFAIRYNMNNEKALRRWFQKPLPTFIYCSAKVLHAFGFSFRDIRDAILAIFTIISLMACTFILRIREYRPWCVFFLSVAFITALQAFLTEPDQRLKTVFFDLPAVITIAIGFMVFSDDIVSKKQHPDTANCKREVKSCH
jgi:hypothetical protein